VQEEKREYLEKEISIENLRKTKIIIRKILIKDKITEFLY
jgi:hypothetical protein